MTSTDRPARNRSHLWHPYTSRSDVEAGLPVMVRGEGVYLFGADGRKYLDAVSSWWTSALGHGHPRLVQAIARQAEQMDHSILGGLNHPAATELAARLAGRMPSPDRRILFASDGASAVEAALKIACQYQRLRGAPDRTGLASLEGTYHGDTLGAMKVGFIEEFHAPYRPLITPALALPFPPADGNFAPARAVLESHDHTLAAVIVEPLCQCAAGMRLYPASWLRSLADWCHQNDTLLIVDEIATGFGRTGRWFAFEHADIDPDIVCLGKALSGGILPLSATVVREGLYDVFDDRLGAERTFLHGHTFCGSAIACAAALEALSIYEEDRLPEEAERKGALVWEILKVLQRHPAVKDVRCLGLMAAVELLPGGGPQSGARRIRNRLFDRGILIRPLDNVVYLLPPLTIPDDLLRWVANELIDAIQAEMSA